MFKAATLAQKRVLIAQDVIAQIELKRYRPELGTWVEPWAANGNYVNTIAEFGENASIRELFLSDKIAACDCCALGAMFMSCTLYNNKTTAEQFESETGWELAELVPERGTISNGLNTFFSPAQLKLIEAAFEGNAGAFHAPETKSAAVEKFYAEYEPEERMIAIMENIIKNNGTFKP